LVPSDFNFFPTVNEFLCARCFKRDDEVKDAIKVLNGLAAKVYERDTQILVRGYDNSLNVDGDCVEK